MKYAILLRKLIIGGDLYYQGVCKIKGYINDDDKLSVINDDESLEKDESDDLENESYNELYSDNDLENYSFLEIPEQSYNLVPDDLINTGLFFKDVGEKSFENVEEAFERENVRVAFYREYRDFDLLPEYDLDILVNDARDNLKKKIKGNDELIENILGKIYHNQTFLNSDMNGREFLKYKANALIIGPHGTGKSLITDGLLESFAPIPVISLKLTGDINNDLNTMMQHLIVKADGNVLLAQKGIVIFDSFTEEKKNISDDGENSYLEELKYIISNQTMHRQGSGEVIFDCRGITNIVMYPCDYLASDIKNGIYYNKVSFDTLSSLGFDIHTVYDLFNEEILYMKEIDYELAEDILNDQEISPFYKIKKALEDNGKTVKITQGFIETLINKGLDIDEGFQGIMRILNYVTQKKNVKDKNIIFSEEDIENLKIGSSSYESFDDVEINNKPKKIINEDKSGLRVNVKKRTINSLRVLDVVKLITNKIKGQDEQVFMIVNSFFDEVLNRYKNLTHEEFRDLKSGVLIIGASGVGKTAIIENLASIFDLPFVREDATRYSGTGIVGDSVEDMFKDLTQRAHGNKEKAEYGMICIDEIDKLAANMGERTNIGGDVQNALLTPLEGNVITIKPGHYEMMPSYEFDTSKVIFFACGAFEGIDKIVKQRVNKVKTGGKMGFSSENAPYINQTITSDDINKYGIIRQLAARFPTVVTLNNLNEEKLLEIINSSKGFVNLKRKSLKQEGLTIELSEGFKKQLAHLALLDKKGARSIKTIYKTILDKIAMKTINQDVEKVILDENAFDDINTAKFVKRKKRGEVSKTF